jgi:hypothetical protein
MRRPHRRLSYANVCSTLALVLALGTGGAYAANTIRSGDIVDGEVKNADLGASAVTSTKINDGSVLNSELGANAVTSAKINTGSVLNADLGDGSVTSAKVANDALTGADIQESSLNVVQGRGELLSNRIVVPSNAEEKTVLAVPGLGDFTLLCGNIGANLVFNNRTAGPVDYFAETDPLEGGTKSVSYLVPPGSSVVASRTAPGWGNDLNETVSLGVGNDPGPRRIATLQVSSLIEYNGAPCGAQVQGTLWTTP